MLLDEPTTSPSLATSNELDPKTIPNEIIQRTPLYRKTTSKIASLEKLVEHLKASHAETVKGLHEEITRLNGVCADLTMKMVLKQGHQKEQGVANESVDVNIFVKKDEVNSPAQVNVNAPRSQHLTPKHAAVDNADNAPNEVKEETSNDNTSDETKITETVPIPTKNQSTSNSTTATTTNPATAAEFTQKIQSLPDDQVKSLVQHLLSINNKITTATQSTTTPDNLTQKPLYMTLEELRVRYQAVLERLMATNGRKQDEISKLKKELDRLSMRMNGLDEVKKNANEKETPLVVASNKEPTPVVKPSNATAGVTTNYSRPQPTNPFALFRSKKPKKTPVDIIGIKPDEMNQKVVRPRSPPRDRIGVARQMENVLDDHITSTSVTKRSPFLPRITPGHSIIITSGQQQHQPHKMEMLDNERSDN